MLLAAALARAERGFDNPVIPGFHPDPSVCRVDSDYYLVTSSFEFFPGVPIYHSRDLVNWRQIGHCLTRPSQLPLATSGVWGGIYAPTIRFHQGTFYMVTTNVSDRGNFFVTATDPGGPWSEPVWLEQKGIDPSLFWDDDGTCYLTSNPDDGIWLCPIDPATGRQTAPSKLISTGTGGRYVEAPHIYKKDGWYYLMVAEGGTEYGHKETIFRSRRIDGPYSPNPANPILTHYCQAAQGRGIQGTGHADLTQAHDGSWWLVCLAFRPCDGNNHVTGRETFLAPVDWPEGGWPVVNGDGTLHERMDVATLPLRHDGADTNATHIDRFDRPLGLEWNYLRNPDMAHYAVSGGHLTLTASAETLDGQGSPTFVGRRQQHLRFQASAKLALDAAEEGGEAGLSVYMKCHTHYDLSLRRGRDGKTHLLLTYRLGLMRHTEADIALPGNAATLRVEGRPEAYAFSYSTDGATFHKIAEMNTRFISSEAGGGFTGAYIALFAQNGKRTKGVFDSFHYEGK